MPGDKATKLLAYIDDFSDSTTAVVQYGNGVTGVDDPSVNKRDSSFMVTALC